MNDQNFVNLGHWWAQKMSRVEDKLRAAVDVELNLNQDEGFLRDQWTAQREAVTKDNPGELTLMPYVFELMK